uniref:Myb/SANT-like DNA-binding domain-containing protein n=1 Tax=Knipowitschia caucasica TaxID=637954 RepID=A0AAV2L4U9_KNICA
MDASGAAPRGPGPDFAFKWSKELTAQFIKLRVENDSLFTGAKFSACTAWRKILEQLGLQGMVSSLQARKKWDNLKKKYKICKYPGTGEGDEGKSSAETWPWFGLMDEMLGPSILGPGPSAGMEERSPAKEQGLELEAPEGETRKRKREDKLVIKNAPEGENTKDPNSWPWYFRMDGALRGRLQGAAKIIHDNEKKELDKPSINSQDPISALNMVEMAPIEDEELFDKSVGGIQSKMQDTVMPATEVAVKESVPSLPKIVQVSFPD